MKKIALFCLLALLLGTSCSKEKEEPFVLTDDTVAVFDDAAFEAFCLRTYDRDRDGVLTVGEIKSVWLLEFDDKDIQSLEGIEYFTGLQYLSCNLAAGGNLVRLDVSRNAELRKLYCYGNKLEELVIKGLRNLVYVDCTSNRLEKLDLRDLPALEVLICRENRLLSLDFSTNPCLTHIDCMDNRISALDVRPCKDIRKILCYGNEPGFRITLGWKQIPVIVADDDVVREVDGDGSLVFDDPAVESVLIEKHFDINGDGRISRHEAAYVRSLLHTKCDGFESLYDFSHLINLFVCELVCEDKEGCKLRSLDSFARNDILYNLGLRNLPITTVDLSRFPALNSVWMSGCDVEVLDVSGLQNLEGLNCVHSPALKTVFFKNRAQYDKILSLQLDQQVLVRFKEDS